MYKEKLEEIEQLKQRKEELKKNFGRSNFNAEKSERMLNDYLKTLERKNTEFKNFMEQKVKEALAHVRRTQQLQKDMKEEIQKLETKKTVKAEEIAKGRGIAQTYREVLEKQNQVEEFEEPGVYYKVQQAFHNMGNNVDYSTTRFHNIMVIRHDDELQEYISAHEKAEKEIEKTEIRQKSKNSEIKKFNTETKINSIEVMRKMQAKENLKKLDEQFDKFREIRKRSKNRAVM
jgi:hypothetical protein